MTSYNVGLMSFGRPPPPISSFSMFESGSCYVAQASLELTALIVSASHSFQLLGSQVNVTTPGFTKRVCACVTLLRGMHSKIHLSHAALKLHYFVAIVLDLRRMLVRNPGLACVTPLFEL